MTEVVELVVAALAMEMAAEAARVVIQKVAEAMATATGVALAKVMVEVVFGIGNVRVEPGVILGSSSISKPCSSSTEMGLGVSLRFSGGLAARAGVS